MADQAEPPPVSGPPVETSETSPATIDPSPSTPQPNAKTNLTDLPASTVSLLQTQLRTTDKTLVRINKLISSPGGLSSFLFTINYTLYILLHLSRQSTFSSTSIISLLTRLRLRSQIPSSTTSKTTPPVSSSLLPSLAPNSLTNLTTLFIETRTTLRLITSLPIYYTWLRSSSLSTCSSQASASTYLSTLQTLSYTCYQTLENLAYLHDRKVITLPKSSTSKKYWLYSARFWCLATSLDLVRLAREAWISKQNQVNTSPTEKETQSESEAETQAQEEKWYADLLTTCCWLPICLHYSMDGGLKGMNQGMVGVLGLMAQLGGLKRAWAKTLE